MALKHLDFRSPDQLKKQSEALDHEAEGHQRDTGSVPRQQRPFGSEQHTGSFNSDIKLLSLGRLDCNPRFLPTIYHAHSPLFFVLGQRLRHEILQRSDPGLVQRVCTEELHRPPDAALLLISAETPPESNCTTGVIAGTRHIE